MNPDQKAFHLSQPIASCLRSVRGMLRGYVVAYGLLLAVIWVLGVFWVGGLVDYLPVRLGSNETPRWLRVAILSLLGTGLLWIFVRSVVMRLAAPLRDRSLALLIERSYPQLNNSLVTSVEASSGEALERMADISNPAAHHAMLERVHASATAQVEQVRPSELFNWQPLWALGVAACFGVVLTLIAALGMSDWFGRWTRRLFTLSDEAWPRQAALRTDGVEVGMPAFTGQLTANRSLIPFEDGRVRVPMGAAVMLQISADSQARKVPEVCTMFYRSADGARGRANLRRIGGVRDGWQQFSLDGPPLDGLSTDMEIDILGLDSRLRDLIIEVVDPTVVSRMELECGYPDYLLESLIARAPQEVQQYRSGISLPEGTELRLLGTASRKLSRVDYVIHSAASQAPDDFAILQAELNGDRFVISLGRLVDSQVVEVRLIDEYGLSSEQIPRYVLTVQEDADPEVDTRLEGIGLAITADAVLPVRGTILDDHAIAEVAAELVANESDPIEVTMQISPDGELNSELDLNLLAKRSLLSPEAGMTLGVVVLAKDYYDLGAKPHVGRGQPLQLSVVTEDQLLVILDRQELELRQRLELILSELEQLRDVLQTLKVQLNTDASALHRPEEIHSFLVSAQGSSSDGESDPGQEAEQLRRMTSMWAQQSVLQSDKSQQELSSVAARVDNLRMQLINNRVDSIDRQERLQKMVHDPLRQLLAGDYETLRRELLELQSATLSGGGLQQVIRSAAALEKVLAKLEAIKASMFDIEEFNEIVDLVRGLLEDQEELLNETEKQQKQRLLDLLK